MEIATTITSKGQVVIPVFYRKMLGMLPGKKVKFSYDAKFQRLTVSPVADFLSFQGILKSKKKYDKKKVRELFYRDLAKGKV